MEPRFAAVIAVSAIAFIAAVSSVAAAASADDGGGGVTITVTVTSASTGTPTGTPSPSPSTSNGGGSGSNSGGSGSGSAVTPGLVPTPAPSEFSLGGVLFVSGISTRYVPQLNPAGGEVDAEFTVQNVSNSTVDSYVGFTLSNPLGFEVSRVDGILVLGLKPHETRTIRTVLTGPGQWTFMTAGFTIIPTSLVNNSVVPSITRNAVVFFFPWLLLVIAFLGLGAYAVVRSVRYFRDREVAGEYA